MAQSNRHKHHLRSTLRAIPFLPLTCHKLLQHERLERNQNREKSRRSICWRISGSYKIPILRIEGKKDGYVQMANIFEETSRNEKEHAKLWFKYLHGGDVPSTEDNLTDAANGENYEWIDMYATFAREAREEGFNEIAAKFEWWELSNGLMKSAIAAYSKHRGRYRLFSRWRQRMAMLQLRPYRSGKESTQSMPRMQPSTELLRTPC